MAERVKVEKQPGNKRNNSSVTFKDKGLQMELCLTISNTSHAIMHGQHLSCLWLVVSFNFYDKKLHLMSSLSCPSNSSFK